MKQTINLKSLILSAALAAGSVATVAAQSPNVAVPNPAEAESAPGELGSRHTKLEYVYLDNLDDAGPSHADGFRLDFNQPLNANFDATAGYDWARARYQGVRATRQDADVGAVAYTRLEWGRPFVMAAVGWQWQKSGGDTDDSFRYKVGVGTEFQVAQPFTVTPFVTFVRATKFNDSEIDYGVRAAYRLTREWSLTASAQYDAVRHSDDVAEYTIGAAFHF